MPVINAPIAIAGPTASGKTAGALAIAAVLQQRHQPVEIISVDSALVYRGMDIGTAKPSAAERAQVPHHLIDIRDPLEAYSAADFVRDTQALVCDIQGRGALPLLVGGTMLYFKALIDGLDDMPPADPTVRAAIEKQATALGWPAMHAQLAQIDPITAARLAPADSQRIQRALEVWQISGQTLSSFHASKKIANSDTSKAEMPIFSLETEHRSWLHQRIALRFTNMIQQGLLQEVQRLRARGDLHADLPSMRCVGYRQTWETLTALGIPADDAAPQLPAQALADLCERGTIATRQLAKRQMTWLRSMPQRQVIACDRADATEELVRQVLLTLEQRKSS